MKKDGKKPVFFEISYPQSLNAMKLLPFLLMIFIVVAACAEEECILNETAYIEFIKKYSTDNRNSTIESDGRTLIVNRNNEEIIVRGGGCIHLGVAIELRTRQAYTEEHFYKKRLICLSNSVAG
jgi:hypothetical protein